METKPLIAIVDDDESVREALSGFVRSLGYAARMFGSEPAFLNSDERGNLSCMIADMQMPEMTGIKLHRAQVAAGEPLPTILITAYPDQRLRNRALQDGVRGYLIKPFTDSELLDCLRSVLDGYGRERDRPGDQAGRVN